MPPVSDRDQRSVVVLATLAADMRLLRGLIAKGADLNRTHAGLTPLIAATRDSHQGRPEAVMTLLTNGADPRCVDPAGNTPLHYAALSATPIVPALLCDAAAPLDAINRDGQSPLATACAAGNWALARFLLERGARIDVGRDSRRYSAPPRSRTTIRPGSNCCSSARPASTRMTRSAERR